MSLLTRTYPTKEWFHLFHARKDFRRAFTGKTRTLGLPCRLIYGYLAMRIKNKPRPTSKRQIATAFGLNMARLNVMLDLLRQHGLVAQVGNEWYAAQPGEEAMGLWFVEKKTTEAGTWHGRLAGVPLLLRSRKTGLCNIDVAVLSLAYNFDDQKVQKYRGVRSLASFLGSTKRTIARSLGRLAQKGFLGLNAAKTNVAWLTTSPSEEQLAYFKDKRRVKPPIAQVLADVAKIDQHIEAARFDPTPPEVQARMEAKKRLGTRNIGRVRVEQLLTDFPVELLLRVDQEAPRSLTSDEFRKRCQEFAVARVTKVEITEDRSDSLMPLEHLGTEKVPLGDNGDLLDHLWLSELNSPAPLDAEPPARKRNPDAPRLTADDRHALTRLHTVLNTIPFQDEPVGEIGWVLDG